MATSWSKVSLIFATGVLASAQLGLVPLAVPALQRDLGLSLAFAGMIISVVTLVGAVFGVVAGTWAERIGYARALWIGLAILALAAGACALAKGQTTLLAARAIAGVGYLLVVTAAPSLLARTADPRDHAVALSLWGTFVPVGIAIAQAISAVVSDRIGWRGLFWLDAGVLAAAVAIAAMSITDRSRPTPDSALSLWFVYRLRAPMLLSVAFFCFALVFLAVVGLLPAYLEDIRKLPMAEGGKIVAATTATGIFGSLAAGWMMRRGASPRVLAGAGLIVSTAATLVMFNAATSIAMVVVAAVAVFAIGGLTPAAVFASVPRLTADVRAVGPIYGLLAQFGSLGSLVGPPLLALWTDAVGWTLAPLLLLAAAMAGAACLLAIAPTSGTTAPPDGHRS
jgi:predicted MFS family arabinose efflux permease